MVVPTKDTVLAVALSQMAHDQNHNIYNLPVCNKHCPHLCGHGGTHKFVQEYSLVAAMSDCESDLSKHI